MHTLLYYIGIIVYNPNFTALFFIILIATLLILSFRFPVLAFATYFILSITNPQVHSPLLNALHPIQLSAIVACLVFLIHLQNIKFRFDLPTTFIFLFLLASCLSYLFSIDQDVSEKRFFEFINITIVALLATQILQTRKEYAILFSSTLLSFLYLIVKNLADTQTIGRWGDVMGSGGWIGDSNDWALALVMVLPLYYSAFRLARTRKMQLFYLASLLGGLLVLSLTSSRGGFLGFAVSFTMLFLFERNKKRLVILLLVMSPLLLHYAPTGLIDEIKSISDEADRSDAALAGELKDKEYSGAQRMWDWKLAYAVMNDHPGTGVGWGNFTRVKRLYDPDASPIVAHDTWLQVGSEAGYIGLVTFALMIGASLFSAFRAYLAGRKYGDDWLCHQSAGCVSALIAYCVSGTFVSREYSDFLYLLFIFASYLLSDAVALASERSLAKAAPAGEQESEPSPADSRRGQEAV